MTLWLDAQPSPDLAAWLKRRFGVDALPVRAVGLRDASDREIFDAARRAGAVVMTKDADFVRLVETLGSPPQIVWLTCGNTSNAALFALFEKSFPDVLAFIAAGERLVEVGRRV